MTIKDVKKLKKDELKFWMNDTNKGYEFASNYEKFIRTYVEGEFSYEDNTLTCDGEVVSDKELKKIFSAMKKSGLGISDIKRTIKAMTKIAKENDKIKEKEAKREEKKNLPNEARNLVKERYGNDLSYNVVTDTIFFRDKKMCMDDYNEIYVTSKVDIELLDMKTLKMVIKDIANERKFKTKLEIDNSNIDNWDLLVNIEQENWESYLEYDNNENLKHSIKNYALFLNFHEQFRGKIAKNSFNKLQTIDMYDKDLGEISSKMIDDEIFDLMGSFMERYFGSVNTKILSQALNVILNKNSYHPVKKKLAELKGTWDGVPRMREMMIKYFDCENNEYIKDMTEVMMCGAVKRILEERSTEGAPFDFMGIMFGCQGNGKTKFITNLFFNEYADIWQGDLKNTQLFVDRANRAWCMLFDEMATLEKADMPTVKTIITAQGHNMRLSYGKRSTYYPNHNIFWGNTNNTYLLRDEGYERRFLIFECKSKGHTPKWWDENFDKYTIDQIWAETLDIYYKKWENKMIDISDDTRNYNTIIQNRHKKWKGDIKVEVELKEILEHDKYPQQFYFSTQRSYWESDIDNGIFGKKYIADNTVRLGKYPLRIVKDKWLALKICRPLHYLDDLMNDYGWKKVELNDARFGSGMFFIRENDSLDDIFGTLKEEEIDTSADMEFLAMMENEEKVQF